MSLIRVLNLYFVVIGHGQSSHEAKSEEGEVQEGKKRSFQKCYERGQNSKTLPEYLCWRIW